MFDLGGEAIWKFETTGPVGRPGVDSDGNVYLLDSKWVLHSLDSHGNLNWTFQYKSGLNRFQIMAPVVSFDGIVALHGGRSAGLVVFDQKGRKLWQDETLANGLIHSQAVFLKNGDLLVCHGWTLRRYHAVSGELKWMFRLPDRRGSLAVVNGQPFEGIDGTIFCIGVDRVVAVTSDGDFNWSYKLDEMGEKRWMRNYGNDWGRVTLRGELLVVAGDFTQLSTTNVGPFHCSVKNERIVCLDRNGKVKWEQPLPKYTKWTVPRSQPELRMAWKTKLGRHTTRSPRFIDAADEGVVYLQGHANGETRLWELSIE